MLALFPFTRGRTTQVWETRITDDEGRLLAHGKVRMLCLEGGAAIGGKRVDVAPPAPRAAENPAIDPEGAAGA